MNKRIIKISLVSILILLFAAFFSYEKGLIGDSVTCCHVSTTVLAQDEPEEEGNSSHTKPEHACNHTGKDENGQKRVPCKCVKHRKCDGTEPRSCKSWCFKDFCLCPNPCV